MRKIGEAEKREDHFKGRGVCESVRNCSHSGRGRGVARRSEMINSLCTCWAADRVQICISQRHGSTRYGYRHCYAGRPLFNRSATARAAALPRFSFSTGKALLQRKGTTECSE